MERIIMGAKSCNHKQSWGEERQGMEMSKKVKKKKRKIIIIEINCLQILYILLFISNISFLYSVHFLLFSP